MQPPKCRKCGSTDLTATSSQQFRVIEAKRRRHALTTRQHEVARLVADGRTTKQIAAEIGVTDRRVRQILSAIAAAIGVDPSSDVCVAIALWHRTRAA